MVSWPKKLPQGSRYDHMVSSLDILPTCLEAAGIAIPENAALDGYSFLEALASNKPYERENAPLFWRFQDHWAVLQGDWKLTHTTDYTRRQPTSQIVQGMVSPDSTYLFNLKTDMAEQENVINQYPEKAEELRQLYEKWWHEITTSPQVSN